MWFNKIQAKFSKGVKNISGNLKKNVTLQHIFNFKLNVIYLNLIAIENFYKNFNNGSNKAIFRKENQNFFKSAKKYECPTIHFKNFN